MAYSRSIPGRNNFYPHQVASHISKADYQLLMDYAIANDTNLSATIRLAVEAFNAR